MSRTKTQFAKEGILCILLAAASYLAAISLSSNENVLLWLQATFGFAPCYGFLLGMWTTALLLGIALLKSASKYDTAFGSKGLQIATGVSFLLVAVIAGFFLSHFNGLFQRGRLGTFWGGLDARVPTRIMASLFWLLCAVFVMLWLLSARKQWYKNGSVFGWAAVIAAGLLGIVCIVNAVAYGFTRRDLMQAGRSLFLVHKMAAGMLVPFAFTLIFTLFGHQRKVDSTPQQQGETEGQDATASVAPAEGQTAAFVPTKGFVRWSAFVAVMNALTLLALGWTIDVKSVVVIFTTSLILLCYGWMLNGKKKGLFWLCGVCVLSVIINLSQTRQLIQQFSLFFGLAMSLVGLVNPLICWILLRNQWPEMK